MAELKKKLKRINWEHAYLYVCLTIITTGSVLLGYWALWPVKVAEFNSPIQVDKTVYRPGERITYTLDYCKYKDIGGTINRALVNSTRTVFTEITGNMAIGCRVTKVSDLVIPDYMDDGDYHIEASIEYQVNPIRTEIVKWQTEQFKIIK